MAVVERAAIYALCMKGLHSAVYSESADIAKRWVKLQFRNMPAYREMYPKIRDSLKLYHTMRGREIPGQLSYEICAQALPPGDVYQIKSAVQIIHFLNKTFDTEALQVRVRNFDEVQQGNFLEPTPLVHAPMQINPSALQALSNMGFPAFPESPEEQ